MHLLLGPALGLVLSATDLRSLNVTVLTRGVLQISTVSLKAICSYSMKQFFLKFSSHSSSCWES